MNDYSDKEMADIDKCQAPLREERTLSSWKKNYQLAILGDEVAIGKSVIVHGRQQQERSEFWENIGVIVALVGVGFCAGVILCIMVFK